MNEIIKAMANEVLRLANEKGIIGITCNFQIINDNLSKGYVDGYFLTGIESAKPRDGESVIVGRKEFAKLTDEITKHEYPELYERNMIALCCSHLIYDPYGIIEKQNESTRVEFEHCDSFKTTHSNRSKDAELFKLLSEEIQSVFRRGTITITTFKALRENGCINCGFEIFGNQYLIGVHDIHEKNMNFNKLLSCPKCSTNYLLVHELLVNALIQAEQTSSGLRVFNGNQTSEENDERVAYDKEISVVQGRVLKSKGWNLGEKREI